MYRQCVLGKFTGQGAYLTTAIKIMTANAKDRIDRFIGEIPNLKQVNKSVTYQFSTDPAINEAYWKGYINAKEELRDKLYQKENIKPVEEKPNNWSPEYNLTIFGEPIYK